MNKACYLLELFNYQFKRVEINYYYAKRKRRQR